MTKPAGGEVRHHEMRSDMLAKRPALVRALLDTFVTPSSPIRDAFGFRQRARLRVFERLLKLRARLGPALATAAAIFAFFDPTPWRRIVLLVLVALVLGLTAIEAVRHRRYGIEALRLTVNLALMVIAQMLIVVATGGLFSPLVPAVALAALAVSILLERRDAFILFAGVPIPAFWVMAYLHAYGGAILPLLPAFLGDATSLEQGVLPWVAASFYTVVLFIALQVGTLLRASFERLFDESMHERDQALKLYAEQSQTLVALGGEIAHELKNPLASVKGLGGLIAKDVGGKTGERVAVLRREVDRMQEIVEGLLNFSRPLVPLSTQSVDLVTLAHEVARLYEGNGLERGVHLAVEAQRTVSIDCDARKVRQVLMNLVQNAIEASPSGGTVTVEILADDEQASVRVRDEGEGLEPRVAERLFEPGVTSKASGSGLGLIVARSLARQHGGELTLAPRKEGGCEAELRLPFALAPVESFR